MWDSHSSVCNCCTTQKQCSMQDLLAHHAKFCMHTQPNLGSALWAASDLAYMRRWLTLLCLHCRKQLTWGMCAQCAYPYSARWELAVSCMLASCTGCICRCTSKCTHYNDRISLLNLLTCTGQNIRNACFQVLSCMMSEISFCCVCAETVRVFDMWDCF